MQAGTCDCGLFTLAYVTTIAHGADPTTMIYDQWKMRRHLYQCLINGKMIPFPAREVTLPKKKIKCIEEIEVFCYCRMPELRSTPMIECSGCDLWFHCACEDVPKMALDNSNEEWLCNNCTN